MQDNPLKFRSILLTNCAELLLIIDSLHSNTECHTCCIESMHHEVKCWEINACLKLFVVYYLISIHATAMSPLFEIYAECRLQYTYLLCEMAGALLVNPDNSDLISASETPCLKLL